MEQKILPVAFSSTTLESLKSIYEYGAETFSPKIAEAFVLELINKVDELCNTYLLHTECRFLPTKSSKYRCLRMYLTSSFTESQMSALKF